MTNEEIMDLIYADPVILAIKDMKDLNRCLESKRRVVFVLFGSVESIPYVVEKLKSAGKVVIVHEDLIEGLSSSKYASTFIRMYTRADGIITTKVQNADDAKRQGLFSVLRFFILDSLAYSSTKESLKKANCDLIEILPGIMPRIIEGVSKRTSIPVAAGGLITEKADVMNALSSGATAISTSNYKVWEM